MKPRKVGKKIRFRYRTWKRANHRFDTTLLKHVLDFRGTDQEADMAAFLRSQLPLQGVRI